MRGLFRKQPTRIEAELNAERLRGERLKNDVLDGSLAPVKEVRQEIATRLSNLNAALDDLPERMKLRFPDAPEGYTDALIAEVRRIKSRARN